MSSGTITEISKLSSLWIKVKTSRPRTEITGFDGTLYLDVKSPPEKGKANSEIIRFLEKKFSKKVRLLSGKTSSRKLMRLD